MASPRRPEPAEPDHQSPLGHGGGLGRRGPRRAVRPPTGPGYGVSPADAATAARSAAVVDAPEVTRDDTDAGWGEVPTDRARDRWLAEQRPPHWGKD